MIKNIKKRFIILATVSMFFLMLILVGIMNAVNYSAVVSEADKVLNMLAEPNAVFENETMVPEGPHGGPPVRFMGFVPKGMSPEVPYEARFFSVVIKRNGQIEKSDISRIVSVDEKLVDEYAKEALDGGHERGFIRQFRYKITSDSKCIRILFLDCGRRLDSFRTFMWISVLVGILGCLIVFLIFLFAADRIVSPIAESYEKQRRFISDAGHEIKTPLTIINANLDLLEDDYEGNEDIYEIRQQTNRLRDLTNDLVYLSKMEETERRNVKEVFLVSNVISETTKAFSSVALANKKEYRIHVEQDVNIKAEKEAVRQLISILLDNAMKYSPIGGIITFDASVNRKNLVISVFNTTEEYIAEEKLPLLFERFYRTDESRNSETGGHGIGLSIAKAITKSHNGKIKAYTQNGYDLTVTVILPLNG